MTWSTQTRFLRSSLALLLLLVVSCEARKVPTGASALPTTNTTESEIATSSASKATPVEAAPPAPAAPLLIDLPRSAPPTVAEWKNAKPLVVKDAQWLGCVAEQVREWVRVGCPSKNFAGAPKSATVVRGRGRDALTHGEHNASSTVASVQFRYGRGFVLETLFVFDIPPPSEFTAPSLFPLKVEWPESSPHAPKALGEFVGVPHISAERNAEAQACYNHSPFGEAPIPNGCLRLIETGPINCAFLKGCTMPVEPTTPPKCAVGEAIFFDRCHRVCRTRADCPDGWSCRDLEEQPVCTDR